MKKNYNIAIDGPAGAGKSTIAKKVAQALAYIYIDTGAMYRSFGLYALNKELSPEDEDALLEACKTVTVKIDYIDGKQQVFLNGENVTELIRTEEVGKMSSSVAKNSNVRNKMVELQKSMAASSNVIMDGRDIGTVVLPNADLKIYLTAGSKDRAERRYKELTAKGILCDVDEIEKDIIDRDYQDMNREVSPLKKAEDAILIDSSNLTIDEVTNKILELFNKNCLY
ncbi:MAG: cmk [Anaerocolumna sp.]|jgi:cytidylate kinase|nr:cmk [Anaerocolumna sp.]